MQCTIYALELHNFKALYAIINQTLKKLKIFTVKRKL